MIDVDAFPSDTSWLFEPTTGVHQFGGGSVARALVTTVAPGSPGIPARDGVNGLFRTLPGDRACLPPSLAEMPSANLTPASGRQDHTTSPSARLRSRL